MPRFIHVSQYVNDKGPENHPHIHKCTAVQEHVHVHVHVATCNVIHNYMYIIVFAVFKLGKGTPVILFT